MHCVKGGYKCDSNTLKLYLPEKYQFLPRTCRSRACHISIDEMCFKSVVFSCYSLCNTNYSDMMAAAAAYCYYSNHCITIRAVERLIFLIALIARLIILIAR